MPLFLGATIVLLGAASVNAADCPAIEPNAIEQAVESVIDAQNSDESDQANDRLYLLWEGYCPSTRQMASGAVVKSLARLLKIPSDRLLTASLLIDVGPNLRVARKAVKSALADQKIRDRDAARSSSPWAPSDGFIDTKALKCISEKIDTGNVDKEVCYMLFD